MKKLLLPSLFIIFCSLLFGHKVFADTYYYNTTTPISGNNFLFDGSDTTHQEGHSLYFQLSATSTTQINRIALLITGCFADLANCNNYGMKVYSYGSMVGDDSSYQSGNTLVATSVNHVNGSNYSWDGVDLFTFEFYGFTMNANQVYRIVLTNLDFPTATEQITVKRALDLGTTPSDYNELESKNAGSGHWYGVTGQISGGSPVFAETDTHITAITSPTVQGQDNDVGFSINLYNGNPTATQFCAIPYYNLQTLPVHCQGISQSGNTSATTTIHFISNGSYSATLQIQTGSKVLDKKNVNFFVNSPSQSFASPTSTDSGITPEFIDTISGWTCNISYLSWDPCNAFASFVSRFLLSIWNQMIAFHLNYIQRPPFSYIGEMYYLYTSSITSIENNASSSLPAVSIVIIKQKGFSTTTLPVLSQSNLYGVLNQSQWNQLRPYIEMIFYLLFGFWLWHYIRSLAHKINK